MRKRIHIFIKTSRILKSLHFLVLAFIVSGCGSERTNSSLEGFDVNGDLAIGIRCGTLAPHDSHTLELRIPEHGLSDSVVAGMLNLVRLNGQTSNLGGDVRVHVTSVPFHSPRDPGTNNFRYDFDHQSFSGSIWVGTKGMGQGSLWTNPGKRLVASLNCERHVLSQTN